MTIDEIKDMMDEIGIPVEYFKFDEDSAVQPPFAVWYFPESVDLFADDVNYVDINHLTIELYTDEKDFALEKTVRDVLTAHGLTYTWDEDYIQEEMLFEVSFEMEVLIDERNTQ